MNSAINVTRNSKLNMARTLLLYTIVFSFQASFCQQSPIAIEVNAAKTVGDMNPSGLSLVMMSRISLQEKMEKNY
jgi:hypothetical protein